MIVNIAKIIGCVIVILLTFFHYFPIIQVEGRSMTPTFKDKQLLLGSKIIGQLKVGDVYVYKSPEGNVVIKRLIQYLPEYKECWFRGDNPEESYDSRDYGYVKQDNIVAKVLKKTEKERLE